MKLAGVLGIPLAAGSWWALAAVPVLAAVLVVLTAAATRRFVRRQRSWFRRDPATWLDAGRPDLADAAERLITARTIGS